MSFLILEFVKITIILLEIISDRYKIRCLCLFFGLVMQLLISVNFSKSQFYLRGTTAAKFAIRTKALVAVVFNIHTKLIKTLVIHTKVVKPFLMLISSLFILNYYDLI